MTEHIVVYIRPVLKYFVASVMYRSFYSNYRFRCRAGYTNRGNYRTGSVRHLPQETSSIKR